MRTTPSKPVRETFLTWPGFPHTGHFPTFEP
jgi:hypothetical protein